MIELGDGVRRFFGLALIVFDEQLDLAAAEQAAGRVDLVDRQLGAFPRRLAERSAVAGQRSVHADDDVAGGGFGAARPRLALARADGHRQEDSASAVMRRSRPRPARVRQIS